MGHLVCIGQWAAFIMVNHAFLGRGRRFRFPCLWAALLAAVFLAASIRHDIGFFNVESVILNIIYLLVTVLFSAEAGTRSSRPALSTALCAC